MEYGERRRIYCECESKKDEHIFKDGEVRTERGSISLSKLSIIDQNKINTNICKIISRANGAEKEEKRKIFKFTVAS